MSDSVENPKPDTSPARRPIRRRVFLWSVLGALAAALIAGFLVFLKEIPVEETKLSGSADGIVVLTGGASRIQDAVELLAAGRGKRLLISGVNPSTTPLDMTKQVPDFARLSACCIDLGHQAQNTLGNAVETSRWASARGFRSLIVVTSSWHMPRALMELQREMPDVTLIPYPVVTDRMRDQSWWSSPQAARLLVYEYLKYLASLARIRLEPAALGDNVKTASR